MDYREVIKKACAEGRQLIPEYEAYTVCASFGIPYPETRFVRSRREAEKAGEELGYPLVIKIVSPEIVHKSDVGGVIVGIRDQEELRTGYDKLTAHVTEKLGIVPIDGVLVQKEMAKGVEVVVGGIRNEEFGPVVMFGSGGILIEVFKDVSFRMVPMEKEEALRQMEETQAYKILNGVRGAKACNLDALADLIVNAGKLLSEIPEIDELDFNPVLAYPDGCVVVDARMVLSKTLRHGTFL
ncbi:acetate--CoA ligase family protein [Candidatus Formimonas warabiya]|uniref:ATP-grasp domain-containing protein n=1 Tax=Formimonas warabiya TaxID=1761012 RepID=A0A3G1KY86_FORW1|nr:acetate--CoA ligase family protein [Candidatus Formimonas warabiya]ATW27436.1 hypothetical protein DCMF_24170 [Candidatus Formimonas warabiya]